MTHEELVAPYLAEPGAVPDTPWEDDLVAEVDASYDAVVAKLPKRLRP